MYVYIFKKRLGRLHGDNRWWKKMRCWDVLKYNFKQITQWKEYGRGLIDRNVPEGNVDGHGAEEQAHAAGDPLGPSERTARGRIHDGHPDVFVPEAGRRPGLENIPDGEKQVENHWSQTVWALGELLFFFFYQKMKK